MALQLGRTFSDGIDRILTRTGAVLLAGLLLIQFLTQAAVNTAVLGFLPPEVAAEADLMLGVTLPVSATVASALFVVSLLLSTVYFVVLSRALTRPVRELSSFPSELYTRRIGRATLTLLVGGAVVGVSIAIGTAMLFVPGVFLAVCFLCFVFVVGVEDRGIVGALRRSWDLSRGNRLKLTVLVVLAAAIGVVVGTVGTVIDLAAEPVVSEVVTTTLASVMFLFLYGFIAAAYLQLREDDSHGLGGSQTSGSMDGVVVSDT